MPSFDIVRHSDVPDSYRVLRVLSDFDMKKDHGDLHIKGTIDLPENWSVGIIYGSSGTGKTTIVKELFPDAIVEDFKWGNGSFLDDFDKNFSFDDITHALYAVGLSSVPSWVRPYAVLSNGEKMRATLARGLLERDFFVFDEFTSVVDRQVAKVCSLAASKFAKKYHKKFLAVSCHSDIVDWLEPDFTFCTNDFRQNFWKARTIPNKISTSDGAGTANGENLAVITI